MTIFFIFVLLSKINQMKKILYIFLIAASGMMFGQTSKKQPLVLVDGMIAPATWTKSNVDANIVSVQNLKGNVPSELAAYKSFASEGIYNVKVKENYYDKMTLQSMNEQFNLAANNPVIVDGRTFNDTSLIILGEAMLYSRIIERDGKKHVAIDTVSSAESKRVTGR